MCCGHISEFMVISDELKSLEVNMLYKSKDFCVFFFKMEKKVSQPLLLLSSVIGNDTDLYP